MKLGANVDFQSSKKVGALHHMLKNNRDKFVHELADELEGVR